MAQSKAKKPIDWMVWFTGSSALLSLGAVAVSVLTWWHGTIRVDESGGIAIVRHSWAPVADGSVELQFWLAVQNSGNRTLVVTQSAPWQFGGGQSGAANLLAKVDDQLSQQSKWTVVEPGKVEMREFNVHLANQHPSLSSSKIVTYVVAVYPSGKYASATSLPLTIHYDKGLPQRVDFDAKSVKLAPVDVSKGAPVLQ